MEIIIKNWSRKLNFEAELEFVFFTHRSIWETPIVYEKLMETKTYLKREKNVMCMSLD